MFIKKTLPMLLGTAMAFGSVGFAHAGAVIDPYLVSGYNLFEDDSNEYLFRPDGNGGFTPITTGTVLAGDLFVQMYDFPIVNGINIDAAGKEFTGIGITKVESTGALINLDPDGAGGPLVSTSFYTEAAFSAGSAADWQALLGIDVTTLGFDPTGLIALLFEDASNNFDPTVDGLANVAEAKDGSLALALALSEVGVDFASSTLIPSDISTFLPSAGETAGVTQYGTFNYKLSVAYEALSGDVPSKVDGSGTNLVTPRPTVAGVIDDTQFSFTRTVPEPSTVALLGISLLGFAANSKKRKV